MSFKPSYGVAARTHFIHLALRELFPDYFSRFDHSQQHRPQNGAKASRSLRITERIGRERERGESSGAKIVAGEESTGEWMAILKGCLGVQV